MILQSSPRGGKWGPTLVINIVALSLGSYLALVYHSAATRRLLAEAAMDAKADMHRQMSDDYTKNISALILSVLIGSVATAAGIGGGAFFVPLFNILLRFSLKGAIALSQAVIAGGAIAGVAVTLRRTHPSDPSKPLMDFDIALMLLPFQLLGVSIGMLANALFPNWLVTLLLLGLLIFLTYKTGRKAWTLHRREVIYLAEQREERPRAAEARKRPPAKQTSTSGPGLDAGETARQPSVERCSPEKSSAASAEVQAEAGKAGTCEESQKSAADWVSHPQRSQQGQAVHSMAEEPEQPGPSRRFESLEVEGQPSNLPPDDVRSKDRGSQAATQQPEFSSDQQADTHAQQDHESKVDEAPVWRQGAVLLLCWGVFVMFTLLLSHYHRCSPAYWSIFAVQAAACVGAETLFICLVRGRKARQAASSLRQPMLHSAYSEAPRWTPARLIRIVIITFLSGVIAGLLGISGASIVNPLLLDFGIHPQAAAATSTLMVLFTSSSAALSFGFSHQLNLQFALVFGLCCMAASLVGVILVQHVVERSGKASIIVFLLALVIATGGFLTAVFGGKLAILDLARHNDVNFSSLCSSN